METAMREEENKFLRQGTALAVP